MNNINIYFEKVGDDMKSIGIWYQLTGNDMPKLEFHINLWNLTGKDKKISPFIDFGIGIKKYKIINELAILFPFSFNEQDLFDLYCYIKDPSIARLIFNDMECEVSSHDKYMVIKSGNFENPHLLINVKNESNLVNDISLNQNKELKMTELCIDFDEIKKDEKFAQYEDLYIRFRIKSQNIKKILFCKVEKKNWFLESGFIENQIVDIKINKERNLPHDFCRKKRLSNYEFAKFDKIHLLVMSDSSNDIGTFGNIMYDCRKLEEHEWDSYLEDEYDVTNVFAYHWKEVCVENEMISDFNKLIRISSATTNIKVISVYMLIVIILGAAGSGLLELIKELIKELINLFNMIIK